MPLRALPRVVDDGNRAGIELGVVLEGVEPDLVPVRVVQLGQDPADAGPVHAGVLLDPGLDLEWLIDTSAILAAAETYLLITHLTGWDLDAYQNWLATTGARLAGAAEGNA